MLLITTIIGVFMINKILNTHHNIVWKSDGLNNIEDAEIICLTETHGDIFSMTYNAFVVDNLFQHSGLPKNEICILLEQPKSLSFDIHKALKAKWIRSTGLITGGWDSDLRLESESIKMERLFHALVQTTLLRTDALDKQVSILKEAYPNEIDLINYETLTQYLNKFIQDFEDYGSKIWQHRTKAMIDTLEESKDYYRLRFLIAGRDHFIQNDRDIQPFLEYLKDKKAVIIDTSEESFGISQKDIAPSFNHTLSQTKDPKKCIVM